MKQGPGPYGDDDRNLADEVSKLGSDVSSLRSSIDTLEERGLYELMDEINDLASTIGSHEIQTNRDLKELRDDIKELTRAQERSAEAQEEIASALYKLVERMDEEED